MLTPLDSSLANSEDSLGDADLPPLSPISLSSSLSEDAKIMRYVILEDYLPQDTPIINLDEEEPPPVIPKGELPKVMSATFAPEVETQLKILDYVNHYLVQNGPVAVVVTTYQVLKLCGKLYLWMTYGQKEQPHLVGSEKKLQDLADESLRKSYNDDLAASGDSSLDEAELAQWFAIEVENSGREPKEVLPKSKEGLKNKSEELKQEELTQSIAFLLEKEGMVFYRKQNATEEQNIAIEIRETQEAPWGEKERILSMIAKIADETLKPNNLYLYNIVRKWIEKYADVFERSIDDYVNPDAVPRIRKHDNLENSEDWEEVDQKVINSPIAQPLWGEHHQIMWTAKQYKSKLGIARPELWRNLHLLGYLIGLSPQFLVLCATAEGVFIVMSLLEELGKHIKPVSPSSSEPPSVSTSTSLSTSIPLSTPTSTSTSTSIPTAPSSSTNSLLDTVSKRITDPFNTNSPSNSVSLSTPSSSNLIDGASNSEIKVVQSSSFGGLLQHLGFWNKT